MIQPLRPYLWLSLTELEGPATFERYVLGVFNASGSSCTASGAVDCVHHMGFAQVGPPCTKEHFNKMTEEEKKVREQFRW